MNFLLHLHVSGSDPNVMVGNFMGDFVKGVVGEQYPAGIREGLQLHRQIDSFAQKHLLFQRSRSRLEPSLRLYRGVMVDLFYDHFLAVEWDSWSVEPFDAWLDRVRNIIKSHRSLLPERLQELVPVCFDELLPSYRHIEGVGRALARMSRRVGRPNPLADGAGELVRNYDGLREDFRGFVPSLELFASEKLGSRGAPVKELSCHTISMPA